MENFPLIRARISQFSHTQNLLWIRFDSTQLSYLKSVYLTGFAEMPASISLAPGSKPPHSSFGWTHIGSPSWEILSQYLFAMHPIFHSYFRSSGLLSGLIWRAVLRGRIRDRSWNGSESTILPGVGVGAGVEKNCRLRHGVARYHSSKDYDFLEGSCTLLKTFKHRKERRVTVWK